MNILIINSEFNFKSVFRKASQFSRCLSEFAKNRLYVFHIFIRYDFRSPAVPSFDSKFYHFHFLLTPSRPAIIRHRAVIPSVTVIADRFGFLFERYFFQFFSTFFLPCFNILSGQFFRFFLFNVIKYFVKCLSLFFYTEHEYSLQCVQGFYVFAIRDNF